MYVAQGVRKAAPVCPRARCQAGGLKLRVLATTESAWLCLDVVENKAEGAAC